MIEKVQENIKQREEEMVSGSIQVPLKINGAHARQEIKEKLLQKFNHFVDRREQFNIVKEYTKRGSRTVVRRCHDTDPGCNGLDIFITERVDYGLYPWQFFKLLNKAVDFCKANRLCKHVDVVKVEDSTDGNQLETLAIHCRSPTILVADRLIFDTKYLFPELMLGIISSEGNTKEKDQYYATHDLKGLQLAFSKINAFQYLPLYSDKNELIGTRTVFMNQTDFGGSVPKWLV